MDRDVAFELRESVLFAEVEDVWVGFSPDAGKYFNLGRVGTQIARLIRDGLRLGEIVAKLQETYAVSADVCEAETSAFIASLLENDLIAARGKPAH